MFSFKSEIQACQTNRNSNLYKLKHKKKTHTCYEGNSPARKPNKSRTPQKIKIKQQPVLETQAAKLIPNATRTTTATLCSTTTSRETVGPILGALHVQGPSSP